MANRRHIKLEETQWILDIESIMRKGKGPFGRKYLTEQLHKMHPDLSIQQLRNEVSGAIQADKYINKRFCMATRGTWDLAKKDLDN